MLRTTNKQVIEKLKIHVLENFAESAEYENDNRQADQPIVTPLDCLISQIDYMQYNNRSIYQTALDYVEGGSLLVYCNEQREFLAELLNETESEASKYSDDKVFKLYCHLVARTMSKLYSEGTK